MIGSNGIEIEDLGDVWRAHGSSNVTDPQMFDYVDRSGDKTGVRYAMGFDSIIGGTRIAYVDYPKEYFDIDDLANGKDVPKMLMRCNICSAMDQAAQHNGYHPYQPRASISAPVVSSVSFDEQSGVQQSSRRVSAGSVISSPSLPKYITTAINIGKSVALRPTGNAAVTLFLSLVSDLASGIVSNPDHREALQRFSDDMADSLSSEDISRIKGDALSIADAIHKDTDHMLSLGMIAKSMLKTTDDLRREVVDDSNRSVALPGNKVPTSFDNLRSRDGSVPSGDIRITRLFGI